MAITEGVHMFGSLTLAEADQLAARLNSAAAKFATEYHELAHTPLAARSAYTEPAASHPQAWEDARMETRLLWLEIRGLVTPADTSAYFANVA